MSSPVVIRWRGINGGREIFAIPNLRLHGRFLATLDLVWSFNLERRARYEVCRAENKSLGRFSESL